MTVPFYQQVRLAADGVVRAGPCRINAILVFASDNDWSLSYHNDVDSAGGTAILELGGQLEGGQTFFDFTNLGGIAFSVGCYLNLTVSSGIVYTWIE